MKSKRYILISSTAVALLLLASGTIYKTSGTHPGSTGAPGDQTCAVSGCHSDAVINQDSGIVNQLLFSSNDTTYIPGNVYTLTLQVTESHTQKFGFELVALEDSSDTNTGTFAILETTRTQQVSHLNGTSDVRYSMTHKTAGTLTTSTAGAIQWRMQWTAPSTNVGTITFWYTTNCTNNDGFETGDYLFLSSFQIKPFTPPNPVGMKEQAKNKNLNVYYDRELQAINLRYASDRSQNGEVIIFDSNGKLVLEQSIHSNAGDQTQKLRMPNTLAKGTYIVKVSLAEKTLVTKLLVD
jgi:hypothetical protein